VNIKDVKKIQEISDADIKECFLQEKNAQSCKEKYTILQEKVHKKCVFFY
jgi:hypothetical protein